MTADQYALLTLAALLACGVGIVVRQIRHCDSLNGWDAVSVWVVSRLIRGFTTFGYAQRMHGRAPLPSSGALVYGNHRGPVDPFFIYSASLVKADGLKFKPIEFLTASEYCSLPDPLGWVMRTARCIPVDRDGRDMGPAKEALRRLQRGRYVGIFPEGKINWGSGLLPFNPGAAWLALRGNLPVHPVYVHNAPQSESMVRAFLMPRRVDAIIGPPVDLSPWKDQRPSADVLEAVANRMSEALSQLQRDWESGRPIRSPRRRHIRRVNPVPGCGCSSTAPATAASGHGRRPGALAAR